MNTQEKRMSERKTDFILGQAVEVATLDSVTQYVLDKAESGSSAYVCFTTAYMLVEALWDPDIHKVYADADMILPDGISVAWSLHSLGHREAECVAGPRLTPVLLREAARRGISVGFYGGRPETLERMTACLRRDLPELKISYTCSPPFRQLSKEEQQGYLDEINASGTQMLFIGLGSPKQDVWMHDNTPRLTSIGLGIGAAFEFLSGEKYLPPVWVQRFGLTWLVRLCQEPRRLIRRNLYSPVFVFYFLKQRLLGTQFNERPSPASPTEGASD